jgi:hypothetical protein
MHQPQTPVGLSASSGKAQPPQAWPVVVVARGRVSAEELVGGSLGIGLEAIHLHFEFAFALVETPDQSP